MTSRPVFLVPMMLVVSMWVVSGCSHGSSTISSSTCTSNHGVVVQNSQGQSVCSAPGTPYNGKAVSG